ncbi:MAG: nucleoside phosphorylase [Desulfurococcales archaeon]|nr:nucleoside phosphorylase [Desulfurococcales archaeon]
MFRIGKGEPVIKPSGRGMGRVPERVLLVFTPRLFRKAKGMLEGYTAWRRPGILYRVGEGLYKGVRVLLALPYWGAPAAAAGLEVLIASGGRLFIMAGLAGAIHPRLRIGDMQVPAWGLREEGTSYHYEPPGVVARPDEMLAERLYQAVERIGRERIRVERGGIWSTDALFRETRDKVEDYSKQGVLSVDMEATALMTVARYRGARLAVVVAVSDELYGSRWNPGFDTRRLARSEKVMIEASLQTLTGEQ